MNVKRHDTGTVVGAVGGSRSVVRQIVTQHPLTTFFALAYLLSWCSVPLTGGQIIPHGPALAAVIILALSEGRSGLSDLWGQMIHWRVGWRWYLVAPGLVAVYGLSAFALNLLLGASITYAEHLVSVSIIVLLFLELLLTGGTWEEPGWTGYALPKLQVRFGNQRFGLLRATLVMCALRALWHLPLVFYGHVPVFEVFLGIGFQLLITWLYNRTNGSVLIVMLFHLTSNVVTGRILTPLFTGGYHIQYYALLSGLAFVTGLLLVRAHRWSMGSSRKAF